MSVPGCLVWTEHLGVWFNQTTGRSTTQGKNQFFSCLTSPVDCGPPGDLQRGSLESYTTTTEGSEVFYSCNPGLVPEGRMRAVCTRNGWSPNPADLSCTLGMF